MVDHGDSESKLDLLFLPEGFQEGELDDFRDDVDEAVEILRLSPSFAPYWDRINGLARRRRVPRLGRPGHGLGRRARHRVRVGPLGRGRHQPRRRLPRHRGRQSDGASRPRGSLGHDPEHLRLGRQRARPWEWERGGRRFRPPGHAGAGGRAGGELGHRKPRLRGDQGDRAPARAATGRERG